MVFLQGSKQILLGRVLAGWLLVVVLAAREAILGQSLVVLQLCKRAALVRVLAAWFLVVCLVAVAGWTVALVACITYV